MSPQERGHSQSLITRARAFFSDLRQGRRGQFFIVAHVEGGVFDYRSVLDKKRRWG